MKPSLTTKLVGYTDKKGWSILFFYFALFGITPNLLLTYQIFVYRKAEVTASTVSIIFMYLMFSWSWFGPFGVWIYERIVRPKFWKEVPVLFVNIEQLNALQNSFDESMLKRYWPIIIIWTIFSVFGFICVKGFAISFGIKGFTDFLFWAWVLFISFLGFISGHGFSGVIDTIRIVRRISKIEMTIDQYHFDGHGGSLCVGNLTIWTFGLFSTGSVFLPILFTALNLNEFPSSFAILLLIFLFCLATTTVFMYPLFLIHYRMLDIKGKVHERIKQNAKNLLVPECISGSCDLNDQLKILNFRNYFVDLDRVVTFPVNTRLFAEIILFAFLPFLMILLQKLLI